MDFVIQVQIVDKAGYALGKDMDLILFSPAMVE